MAEVASLEAYSLAAEASPGLEEAAAQLQRPDEEPGPEVLEVAVASVH